MGGGLVQRAREAGITTYAWNRSENPLADTKTVEELITKMPSGERVLWLMLPAGTATEEIIENVLPQLDKGDTLIDGGNAYYKDSVRRAEKAGEYGIKFFDVGTSGGPEGARNGACLMIGGDQAKFTELEELWKALSAPGAYQYLGTAGAGHYAKMVHNGIEYGMMQAIAEGVAVLDKSEFDYDLAKVLDIYNHRSVIESRLVGWMKKAIEQDPKLNEISSVISHTGEGEWTVKTAEELSIEIPVIKESLEIRKRSVKEPESFRNKAVSALRGQFGGHKVSKD